MASSPDAAPAAANDTACTLLAGMETSYELGPRWANAPLSWTKRLLPAQKGRIGERLWREMCETASVAVANRTGSGHDLRCADLPVEVKFGTLHDNDPAGEDRVEFLQLRPNGDFTHVALVCVCPDHVHAWFAPRDVVLANAHGQHGGKDATETLILAIDPHRAPRWLGKDLACDLGALKRKITSAARGTR